MVSLAKTSPVTEVQNGSRSVVGNAIHTTAPQGPAIGPAPIAQFEELGFVELGADGFRFVALDGVQF